MIVASHLSGRTRATLSAIAMLFAAACGSKTTAPSPTPPTTTCTIAITGSTTMTFGAEGGAASIPVAASTGCAWTATSSASFVTISQGASGNGNGTVQLAVAANTGAERTATVAISGITITITQRAPAGGSPTIAAPIARSPSAGQVVDSLKPTLTATNAVTTGTVGTVTYRFEISELDSFPVGSRTAAQDGVPQGSGGTTSFTVSEHALAPNQLFFWRVQATNGTITSAFSNTETFRTPTTCTFTVSPPSISAGAAAGTATITVTAGSACAWTAASNDAFITVTSGASGTGDGTVAIAIAANSGAARTGTLTIAGQTVPVSQSASGQGAGLSASFRLFDPARQGAPTTECQFRSATSDPTTCTLESTSIALGTNVLASWTWTVQYTYVTVKTLTQTGTNPRFSFTDVCGQFSSTDDGAIQPLSVQLTVTDNLGNTATATSGTGSQAALQLRLFTCGK